MRALTGGRGREVCGQTAFTRARHQDTGRWTDPHWPGLDTALWETKGKTFIFGAITSHFVEVSGVCDRVERGLDI